MSIVVRSNTPSLYDNPKLSAKALNNQFTNTVFHRAASTTAASTPKGLDTESKWTIGLGLLGLASTFALGLINKKTTSPADADADAKAKAKEEADAKLKEEEERKAKLKEEEKLNTAKQLQNTNSNENQAKKPNAGTSPTNELQNKTDSETQVQPEKTPLGSESNPIALGEVVINAAAPKPLTAHKLTGITITDSAPNIKLPLLFASQVKNNVTPNETNTQTQTTMSKQEKDTKMDILLEKQARIQSEFKTGRGDFKALDLVKHEIANLEKVQTKES